MTSRHDTHDRQASTCQAVPQNWIANGHVTCCVRCLGECDRRLGATMESGPSERSNSRKPAETAKAEGLSRNRLRIGPAVSSSAIPRTRDGRAVSLHRQALNTNSSEKGNGSASACIRTRALKWVLVYPEDEACGRVFGLTEPRQSGEPRQWSREILPQSGGDLFQRPVYLVAGDN